MKTSLVVATVAVLIGAAASAQLRITSFTSTGELTWTNSPRVGAYRVQWADSPAGPWNAFDAPTDLNLILAETNRIRVQVPLSNAPAFYRVIWIPPEPVGVWDYWGYDAQGVLVVTGVLNLAWATNSPPYYPGGHDFKYVGAPTNNYMGWLGPQIGTGGVQGYLDIWAHLGVTMPTNTLDYYASLSGTLWPNTYTGR